MDCPVCSHTNAEELVQCEKCSTPLPINDQTLGPDLRGGWSVPADSVVVSTAALKPLTPGTILGARYEIIRLLGQGGMGAVYQARDQELERQVALKVIRADMAANPELLRRFKQELILARQITHKNVIRIFDLGQADGFKFITMEYIEGEDLQALLKQRKKLEPADAAKIIAQVCRALEVAHAEGVVHRDLKPQNIMLDKTGRVYVMDFGIARSTLASSMTQTGALIGTPDYMSPEQAKGQTVDARSDLFAVGIIFYEILSGQSPFNADTTMGKLWKRTSEPARPLGELDKTIPQPLSEIVKKCLEIDPEKRFASATELLHAIEDWQGPGAGTRVTVGRPSVLPGYAKWVVAGIAVVLAAAGFLLRPKLGLQPAAPHAPVTLLIADFDNKTGDAVFDGTLEPMLGIALEGAPFISSYNRGQAKKAAARLQPGMTHLDASLAQLVAVREGLNVVVSGSITQEGSGYTVSVASLDTATGKPIVQEQRKASSKQDVLAAAGKLAERIRKGLGDTTPESAQQSAAETFTAASLEAAHAYAMGQDLQQTGKWDEAKAAYNLAVELDPDLGRAYAGLAAMDANTGKKQEAERNYQAAMSRIDRMTEREKYRTRSGYYLLMRNQPKAIEELAALVKQYPSDTAGHANLALAYFYQRDMTKALEEQKRAIEITPHSVQQRSNLSLYALYAGDFDAAANEAHQVLKENPKFEVGLRTLALAKLGGGHPEEARKEYDKLMTLSARGASMAATGLADLALYEGRFADAVAILQKGIIENQADKDADSAAYNQATLALTLVALNKPGAALAPAGNAANRDEGILYRVAQVYEATGQESRALAIAGPLGQRLETEPQIYSKLILGEAQLKYGNAREAVNVFQEAQKLGDTWLGHFDLGRAYLDTGAFTEASSEFDVCLKRRGEVTSVFLDDMPSYHYLPPVYYYQGRAREGLKSAGAVESYKTFLAMKEKGAGDPLVVDAQKRLAALK
ncbi:MAG TPA: protein kinase [Candidatus Acidoferrum sp.]|nr:protein kinase [Candidatus Acidoferrum sp.]